MEENYDDDFEEEYIIDPDIAGIDAGSDVFVQPTSGDESQQVDDCGTNENASSGDIKDIIHSNNELDDGCFQFASRFPGLHNARSTDNVAENNTDGSPKIDKYSTFNHANDAIDTDDDIDNFLMSLDGSIAQFSLIDYGTKTEGVSDRYFESDSSGTADFSKNTVSQKDSKGVEDKIKMKNSPSTNIYEDKTREARTSSEEYLSADFILEHNTVGASSPPLLSNDFMLENIAEVESSNEDYFLDEFVPEERNEAHASSVQYLPNDAMLDQMGAHVSSIEHDSDDFVIQDQGQNYDISREIAGVEVYTNPKHSLDNHPSDPVLPRPRSAASAEAMLRIIEYNDNAKSNLKHIRNHRNIMRNGPGIFDMRGKKWLSTYFNQDSQMAESSDPPQDSLVKQAGPIPRQPAAPNYPRKLEGRVAIKRSHADCHAPPTASTNSSASSHPLAGNLPQTRKPMVPTFHQKPKSDADKERSPEALRFRKPAIPVFPKRNKDDSLRPEEVCEDGRISEPMTSRSEHYVQSNGRRLHSPRQLLPSRDKAASLQNASRRAKPKLLLLPPIRAYETSGEYSYNPKLGLFSTFEDSFCKEYNRDTYLAQQIQRKLAAIEERETIRDSLDKERLYQQKLEQQRKLILRERQKKGDDWIELKRMVQKADSITYVKSLQKKAVNSRNKKSSSENRCDQRQTDTRHMTNEGLEERYVSNAEPDQLVPHPPAMQLPCQRDVFQGRHERYYCLQDIVTVESAEENVEVHEQAVENPDLPTSDHTPLQQIEMKADEDMTQTDVDSNIIHDAVSLRDGADWVDDPDFQTVPYFDKVMSEDEYTHLGDAKGLQDSLPSVDEEYSDIFTSHGSKNMISLDRNESTFSYTNYDHYYSTDDLIDGSDETRFTTVLEQVDNIVLIPDIYYSHGSGSKNASRKLPVNASRSASPSRKLQQDAENDEGGEGVYAEDFEDEDS